MSIPMIAAVENVVHAERWRQWQVAYAASSGKSATRARIVFTVLLAGLAIAFGVQLMSM